MESSPVRPQSASHAFVKLAAAAVCALLALTTLANELRLEVIELHHRLVRDVIPLLQPLLAPGGTLTGTANQLIVRSTRENLAEIQEVVASIDTRIRQLKITVTQDLSVVQNLAHDGLSADVRAGDFGASVRNPGTANAGMTIEGEHAGVRYESIRTRSQNDDNNLHFVVTLEGQPAFIATGQALPYAHESAVATPYGVQLNRGIGYEQVSSGVYVTPRLQGERVILDIAPQLERTDPNGSGVISTHATTTTVTGNMGEWIAISGASNQSGGNTSELLARTQRQGDNSYTVWVKVEEQ
jgi:type II secretory pathway component GspD/PulD (secretin)